MMIEQKYLEYCNQHSGRLSFPSTTTTASASAQSQVFQGVNGLAERIKTVRVCITCGVNLASTEDACCEDCCRYFPEQISSYTKQVDGVQSSHQHKGAQNPATLATIPSPPFTSSPFELSSMPNAGTKSLVSRQDFVDLTQSRPNNIAMTTSPDLPVKLHQHRRPSGKETVVGESEKEQAASNPVSAVTTPAIDQSTDSLQAATPTSSPTPLLAAPRKKGGRIAYERATCDGCGKEYPFSRITEATTCTRCIRKTKKKAARMTNAKYGPAVDDEADKMPAWSPSLSQQNGSQDDVASLFPDSTSAMEQMKAFKAARPPSDLKFLLHPANLTRTLPSRKGAEHIEALKPGAHAALTLSQVKMNCKTRIVQNPMDPPQQAAPVAPILSQTGQKHFTQEDLDTIAPHKVYDPEKFVPLDEPIQSIERETDPAAEAESTMTWQERVDYGYVAPWEMDHNW